MIIGNIANEMQELNAQLCKELKEAKAAFRQRPDGFMITGKRNNRRDYIHCTKKRGVRIRHRINTNNSLIVQMLEKRYLKEKIFQLESAIKTTETFIDNLVDPSDENIRLALYKKYNMTPQEILRPTSDSYSAIDYEQFTGFPEGKVHQTSCGIKVRSKSEVLITEALTISKIKFHYEEVCRIDSYELYPDFHCWANNGSEYYWEHFGLMDNPEYRQRYYTKMKEYESVGIVPWKNLICTYDQEDGHINMKIIYSIINSQLK